MDQKILLNKYLNKYLFSPEQINYKHSRYNNTGIQTYKKKKKKKGNK